MEDESQTRREAGTESCGSFRLTKDSRVANLSNAIICKIRSCAMKINKLLPALLLVFSLFSMQGASAATLSWTSLPSSGGSAIGDGILDSAILTGMFVFNQSGSNITHTWGFSLNSSGLLKSAVSVLIDFDTSVSNVTVAGQDLTNYGSGQWGKVFVSPLTAGAYSVVLTGLGYISGSQYNISLKVSPVPVPAAVWLFASGMVGLIGISRRRKI